MTQYGVGFIEAYLSPMTDGKKSPNFSGLQLPILIMYMYIFLILLTVNSKITIVIAWITVCILNCSIICVFGHFMATLDIYNIILYIIMFFNCINFIGLGPSCYPRMMGSENHYIITKAVLNIDYTMFLGCNVS